MHICLLLCIVRSQIKNLTNFQPGIIYWPVLFITDPSIRPLNPMLQSRFHPPHLCKTLVRTPPSTLFVRLYWFHLNLKMLEMTISRMDYVHSFSFALWIWFFLSGTPGSYQSHYDRNIIAAFFTRPPVFVFLAQLLNGFFWE